MDVFVVNIWIENHFLRLLLAQWKQPIWLLSSFFSKIKKIKKLHKVLKYIKGGSYLLDLGLKGLI